MEIASRPPEMATAFGALGLIFFVVIGVMVLAILAFKVFLAWRICSKAGYSGALGLLLLVPFGEFIVLCILAFARWPALQDLDNLRHSQLPPRQQV